jgi:hypothetical protein
MLGKLDKRALAASCDVHLEPRIVAAGRKIQK